MQHLTNVQKLK